MLVKKFQTTAEGYTIYAEATLIGKDVSILIIGGDSPHIGTITSISKNSDSETIRFHSHHGRFHKDDVLSELIIKKIKNDLPGNCVIIAGVHVNHITREQINASSDMAEQLGNEILVWLQQTDFSTSEVVYAHYNKTFEE